jgi:hypothetical protein
MIFSETGTIWLRSCYPDDLLHFLFGNYEQVCFSYHRLSRYLIQDNIPWLWIIQMCCPWFPCLCISCPLQYLLKIPTHMWCSRKVRVHPIFTSDADVRKYSYIRHAHKLLKERIQTMLSGWCRIALASGTSLTLSPRIDLFTIP